MNKRVHRLICLICFLSLLLCGCGLFDAANYNKNGDLHSISDSAFEALQKESVDDTTKNMDETAHNEAQKSPVIRIACVGDSLTWGQALNNTQSANPYPKILQEKLGAEEYLVKNFGASGRVMSEGYREETWDRSYNLTSAYRDSIAFCPDIVIICLGTNDAAKCDVTSDEGKAHFLQSAKNLIADYREAGATEIYLCLPPYNSNASYSRMLERRVLPLIQQSAEENSLHLIDFFTPTYHQNNYLLSDSLHLTDEGYALMAQIVFDSIIKK